MLFVLIFLDVLVTSAKLTGDYVCQKGTESACCSDYEEQKDRCIKCQPGYTSETGDPCIPCTGKRFGNRCIKQCNCTSNERCDHISGCQPFVETATNTRFGGGDNSSMGTEESYEAIEMYHLIIYASVATFIMFVMALGLGCFWLRKRNRPVYQLKTEEEINATLYKAQQQSTSTGKLYDQKIEESELEKMSLSTENKTDDGILVDLEIFESNKRLDEKASKKRKFQTFRESLFDF